MWKQLGRGLEAGLPQGVDLCRDLSQEEVVSKALGTCEAKSRVSGDAQRQTRAGPE